MDYIKWKLSQSQDYWDYKGENKEMDCRERVRLYNQLSDDQKDHITNIILKNSFKGVVAENLVDSTLYEYKMEGVIK